MLKLLVFIIMIFLSPEGRLFAKEPPSVVYFGINTDTSLPFVELDRSSERVQLKSGILKNLSEAIAKEMNVQPIWIFLPKERVSQNLSSGYVEIICYLHESWEPELVQKAFWSHAIYTNTNLIVSTSKKPMKRIEDLYGKTVGTIVNFHYGVLDPAFKKGLITRENGVNSESNMQKLIHGRVQFLAMSNLEFDYYKKKYPQKIFEGFHVDSVKVKCVLSKKSKISLARLNKAIDALKKKGSLEKIFRL